MTTLQVENWVKPRVTLFVEALDGHYRNHVSDEFLTAYLMRAFARSYRRNPRNPAINIAYYSSVALFESLLEHGCRTEGSGHQVAQAFAELFENEELPAELETQPQQS